MRLDVAGLATDLGDAVEHWVEALDVPDLEDALLCPSSIHQLLALVRRRRDGLLDQNVDTGVEEATGNFKMVLGGHHHRDRIDAREQIAVIRKRHDAVIGDRLCPRLLARIGDSGDLALGLETFEQAKVVPTEVADANHADSNPLHASTSVNFSSASDTSLPATLQRARTCPTCGFARIVSTSMRN